MNISKWLMALNNVLNFKKIGNVLKYIEKHPSKEGQLAKKAYKRLVNITLLIIFLIMLPLCIYTILRINRGPIYPDGATKRVIGHIGMHSDTFWYTDSSNKYTFDLNDYSYDENFEHGENILIYLDDNDNVISITHKKEDIGLIINVILMYLIPITLLLLHVIIGRKTYCKWWYLYTKWYQIEIEPYQSQINLDENKQYYDVEFNINQLIHEDQILYRKIKNKNILYILMLLICIILTIYLCIKYNLDLQNYFVVIGIILYVIVFYILINNNDKKIEKIRSKYYKK